MEKDFDRWNVKKKSWKKCMRNFSLKLRIFGGVQRRLATLDDADFIRVKQKLETLLELFDHHQSDGSGSVGNPKSNPILDEAKTEVKLLELGYDEIDAKRDNSSR